MDFLKQVDLKPMKIVKVIVVIAVALIGLVFIFSLLKPFINMGRSVTAPSIGGGVAYDYDSSYNYAGDKAMSESSADLSIRNSYPGVPPMGPTTVGDDAELFETKEYTAEIETRNKTEVCAEISKLKSLDYVIFENSGQSEYGCNFRFKVTNERSSEILSKLKEWGAQEPTENTYTIKMEVDDFTGRIEILEKKRDSIQETLKNALIAYDEITNLATRAQNVESLAKIIDSKLQMIERLTQDSININAELERLNRAKTEALDRLEYTYFYVNVYENRLVNVENIKDSWKYSVQKLVRSVNQAVQDATVNLVAFIVTVLPYIIYFFVLVLIAKYIWKGIRRIWM